MFRESEIVSEASKRSHFWIAGPFVILSILFSIPFISIFRPPRAFLLAELLSYSKVQLDISMYVCVLTILLNGFLTFVTPQVVYFELTQRKLWKVGFLSFRSFHHLPPSLSSQGPPTNHRVFWKCKTTGIITISRWNEKGNLLQRNPIHFILSKLNRCGLWISW